MSEKTVVVCDGCGATIKSSYIQEETGYRFSRHFVPSSMIPSPMIVGYSTKSYDFCMSCWGVLERLELAEEMKNR